MNLKLTFCENGVNPEVFHQSNSVAEGGGEGTGIRGFWADVFWWDSP